MHYDAGSDAKRLRRVDRAAMPQLAAADHAAIAALPAVLHRYPYGQRARRIRIYLPQAG